MVRATVAVARRRAAARVVVATCSADSTVCSAVAARVPVARSVVDVRLPRAVAPRPPRPVPLLKPKLAVPPRPKLAVARAMVAAKSPVVVDANRVVTALA